jgi:SAM-dependent methyltransferase
VRGRAARLLEVGGGLGWVGAELKKALGSTAPLCSLHLDLSPALSRAQRGRGLAVARADAKRLPARPGSIDLLISNEMAGDLGTEPQGLGPDGNPRLTNTGALQLVREAAAALAPGGLLYLSEFGELTADPVRSDHLDHDEWSIRFLDLQEEAKAHGLSAKVVPVPELIGLDGDAQALTTTRASYAALKALFADQGLSLGKRAWMRTEIESLCQGKLDLAEVHGLLWAPLSERTMGLSPRQFWALVAVREHAS